MLRSDGKGEYTAFVVELTLGTESWTVLRRYSEFHALNAELQVGGAQHTASGVWL